MVEEEMYEQRKEEEYSSLRDRFEEYLTDECWYPQRVAEESDDGREVFCRDERRECRTNWFVEHWIPSDL